MIILGKKKRLHCIVKFSIEYDNFLTMVIFYKNIYTFYIFIYLLKNIRTEK